MIPYSISGERTLDIDNKQDVYILVNEWLEKYKKATNKYSKAKYQALIVTKMLPIIRRIASTIARRSYDPVEDMVQAGSIGLLKAISSYTLDMNIEFRIYAGRKIIGEMKHFLRDKLNSIRVPRHIQELVYRINTFTGSLTQEELHDLTSSDVAMALNIPETAVDFALEADRRTSVISLEDLFTASEDSLGYEEVISKDDYKETSDIEDAKLILTNVIKNLPEDCKPVVELFYYKDMNQKEIAEYLNMTQMSVGRRLKKAFGLLHKMISDSNLVNIGVPN